MKKLFFFLLIVPLVISSCKKGEDDEVPTITINAPANGFQANVYDTLHVSIHCADNVSLQNLNVDLETTDLIPVLSSVSVAMSGKSYDATFNYIINNPRILSGNYYLSVQATDGSGNLGRAYSNIYVTGIPKILKGFFAATIPTPGTLNVYKCDTSWAPSIFNTSVSDFTDMAVSNYWQQVYVNGSFSGPLKAISIDGTTTGFSIPSIVGSSPYWGPMSVKDARLWVSYRGLNQFKSVDQNGTTNFTGNSDTGLFPGLTLQNGNKIIAEQRDLTSAVKIEVFNTTGTALYTTPLPYDPIAMFVQDANCTYLVANNGSQGGLAIYDDRVGLWSPISLPAGTVTSATQIDSNTLLIGMSTGTISKFTYNPVGLVTWASGINSTQLRYDDVNGQVYSVEGSNVKVYNYNPFSLQRTIPIPEAISDLELWYNY